MLVANHEPSSSPIAFGRWLLTQTARPGPVGELAQRAARDPAFPRDGSPDAVSCRLNEAGADGDVHHALEEAELDYLCL